MAGVNGRLETCDRCGCTIFRKYTGTQSADGGWTTWDTFESRPDGWEYHSEVGLLCPSCAEAYQRLKNTFMQPPPVKRDPAP